jgi:two-component system sporulation sensor kinase A
VKTVELERAAMRKQKQPDYGCRMTGDLFAPLIRQSDDIYVSLHSDMTVEYISPSVERVLGYRPEEVTGQSGLMFILPEDLSRIGIHLLYGEQGDDPDGNPRIRHVAEVSESYRANRGAREIRLRHRDGRYIWFRAFFVIERDEQGAVERIVAVGRDITERKRAEEELRRIRANLMLARRVAGFGYFEWCPETNELYLSDEVYAVFGRKRSEFESDMDAFNQIVHPEDKPGLKAYFLERTGRGAGDEDLKYEYRIIAPDGSVRTIQAYAKWMADGSRGTYLLGGIVRDVTIENRTTELLRTSEKLKMAGQLAAGIAHEIRNPLTSLKGFSRLLLKATGEQAERYYEIMDQEFVRIEMILGELLVLTKPQQASVYQDQDVRLIVHEVADLLSSQAILNNVIIQEHTTPEPCVVRCDKNQLKQVFMNIVKNAIEAMPAGGLLVISIERDGKDVLVQIIDQGDGIPEDHLRRLGEPFFTTKEKGTGLGLMISHKIIEEHDGHIRYDSRTGEGTTVTIRLPRSSGESGR